MMNETAVEKSVAPKILLAAGQLGYYKDMSEGTVDKKHRK